MFPPDADNDWMEPLVTGGLAVAGWRALASASDGLPRGARLVAGGTLAALVAAAGRVATAASAVDVGEVLDPVIGGMGPWLAPSGGIDDAPGVFAAARVSEAVLRV
jgi:hypothetical protein